MRSCDYMDQITLSPSDYMEVSRMHPSLTDISTFSFFNFQNKTGGPKVSISVLLKLLTAVSKLETAGISCSFHRVTLLKISVW